MNSKRVSYSNILKSTSLFGGVQLINIIIQILRSKVIALLLGSAGIGLIGLYNTTINLVFSLTNFGLSTSGVKELAQAESTKNFSIISYKVSLINKIIFITSLLGAFFLIIFSNSISELTFENKDYSSAFKLLSISIFFKQLTSGKLIILQGLRRLNFLAKANVIGNLLGLIFTLPLYFLFDLKAIVPAIIITSIITFLVSWYFTAKNKINKINISLKNVFTDTYGMLTLGFFISVSGLLTAISSYLIRIFIVRFGSQIDLGLFTAGFAIVNSYVGLIFTAMATDYFPRLSSVSKDRVSCNKIINQQGEISILIITPIMIFFLIFINWIIIFLYSNEFIMIEDMMHWAILAIIFKTAGWCIGFLFLAKGDVKLFFFNELGSNIYMLLLNVLGYYYYGLEGLGVSYLVGFFLHLIQMILVSKSYYNFKFENDFIKLFLTQLLFLVISFITVKFLDNNLKYFLSAILLIFSVYYTFLELDKRIDIKTFLHKFIKKIK